MNHGLAQVGKLFKDSREKLNLSQAAVASRLNERLEGKYLHTTIGKIENGRRNITLEEAVQLSDILHVKWEEVFSLLRQMTPADRLNDATSILNRAAFDCATEVYLPFQHASELIQKANEEIDEDSTFNGHEGKYVKSALHEIKEAVEKLMPLADLISHETGKIADWTKEYVPEDEP
ncbi:hypothetical protein BJF89_14200 [Corynebacterium sp. CNJ-954]|jgi:transcriptional regulator with XRE-family HTH domain|uniref:helix-turn-helix domain-containing protein n=1 Tax=Corynebacterium sp. CNJ-954 TaxID=1904962 RepID=UPI0009624BBE|nr:helix-turn-helix transcriptional regulator [Corynebacterium sp. CNJ-954]OLT55655.1 hypothetical protein BJF89_14200 [Corynebacterium sp. CNJ-954]